MTTVQEFEKRRLHADAFCRECGEMFRKNMWVWAVKGYMKNVYPEWTSAFVCDNCKDAADVENVLERMNDEDL